MTTKSNYKDETGREKPGLIYFLNALGAVFSSREVPLFWKGYIPKKKTQMQAYVNKSILHLRK